VGDFCLDNARKLCISLGSRITARLEIAMIFAWQEPQNQGGGCGTRIAFPAFDRNRQCTAFSVIRKRV
jgi:hypothetical protein